MDNASYSEVHAQMICSAKSVASLSVSCRRYRWDASTVASPFLGLVTGSGILQ